MTMTFGRRGGLAALALAVGACSPSYYRISTELVTSSHGSRAEVTTTKAYETDALRVTRVALLAPDECSDQSATQTRGTGRDARALVKLRCGVEMMLLERELASVGYQVISWRALSEMVGREEHITSLEAARRLGADVVFQMNSLEKAFGRVNQDARWERHFFHAADGGATAMVEDDLARQFEALVGDEEQQILGTSHLSVTADASVVRVDNGQVIWFYHWTQLDAASSRSAADVMVACKDRRCWRVKTIVKDKAAPAAGARAGGMQAISLAGQPLSQKDATYYQLTQGVVRDLVSQFTGSVPVAERRRRARAETATAAAPTPAATSTTTATPVAAPEPPAAPVASAAP